MCQIFRILRGISRISDYGDREISLNDSSDLRQNKVHIAMADLRHALGRQIEFRSQFLYEKKNKRERGEGRPEFHGGLGENISDTGVCAGANSHSRLNRAN